MSLAPESDGAAHLPPICEIERAGDIFVYNDTAQLLLYFSGTLDKTGDNYVLHTGTGANLTAADMRAAALAASASRAHLPLPRTVVIVVHDPWRDMGGVDEDPFPLVLPAVWGVFVLLFRDDVAPALTPHALLFDLPHTCPVSHAEDCAAFNEPCVAFRLQLALCHGGAMLFEPWAALLTAHFKQLRVFDQNGLAPAYIHFRQQLHVQAALARAPPLKSPPVRPFSMPPERDAGQKRPVRARAEATTTSASAFPTTQRLLAVPRVAALRRSSTAADVPASDHDDGPPGPARHRMPPAAPLPAAGLRGEAVLPVVLWVHDVDGVDRALRYIGRQPQSRAVMAELCRALTPVIASPPVTHVRGVPVLLVPDASQRLVHALAALPVEVVDELLSTMLIMATMLKAFMPRDAAALCLPASRAANLPRAAIAAFTALDTAQASLISIATRHAEQLTKFAQTALPPKPLKDNVRRRCEHACADRAGRNRFRCASTAPLRCRATM